MKTLKTGRINNIVFVGRFVENEILSGPEKFSKRIFGKIAAHFPAGTTSFIQYFFDGRIYSLREKLFGFQEAEHDVSKVYRAGSIRFYRLLKKLNPAVIHITAFERFAVIAVLYRLLNRAKIVYTCNGIVKYENSALKRVSFIYKFKDSICERMLFWFSDVIVFPSGKALELSKHYYKNSELKSVVIPNGIDEVFKHAAGNKAHQAETGKAINAVFIYKNEMNDSGLNFLKSIPENISGDIIIHIITKHEINTTGINSAIKLIKPMDTIELAEFYNDKDVFFSLNEYDTFSISTAEAMASGVLPVVTLQSGISSFIKNEINGFTLNYGDSHALAEIISKIQSMDHNARLNMKQNASDIYEKLNWSIAAESYIHKYKQLAGDIND